MSWFRGIVICIVGILIGAGGMWWGVSRANKNQEISLPIVKEKDTTLEKYTIENLRKRNFSGSVIELDEAVATMSGYTVHLFHFYSDGKRVNGMAHIPEGAGPFPVIVQARGYAELDGYKSGNGTRRSAAVYAANGYLTLAPDFLGYGGSDSPSENVWEARFETYTTMLNLLASISSLPMADTSRVGLWGHSNGGQIVLTVLEILQKNIPATLWAPVSAPFPYSVLYYTYDYDDHGKALRKSLAAFENTYDVELYALINYLDGIQGPVQVHQGSEDPDIPLQWTNQLVSSLKNKEKDVTYWTYPGADHNMLPSAWSVVVARDIEFFQDNFQ